MKHLIYFLLLTSSFAFAQGGLQDQYQFNYLAINPAFTGERGNFGFTAQLGNQFNGTIAPNQVSQIFALDGKVGSGNGALGFQGYRINQGGIYNSGLNLNYGHEIKSDNFSLRLGSDVGVFILPNFITNADVLDRFSVYFGFGALFQSQNFFASIASPTIITFKKTSLLKEKPVTLLLGYSFSFAQNIQLNLSTLASVPSDNNYSRKFHLNAKLWLSDKFGFGGSFRYLGNNSSVPASSKFIPTVEYKISSGSRLGLSYDSSPLSDITNNPQYSNPNGIFQLLYRYDLIQDGQKTPLSNNF